MIEVELPTGTVTLLFTDIEGSTRMLRSLGDDYGAVLRAHRAARICSAAHGGQVLVSEATRVATAGRHQVALRDLGHHRLKDLDRPEHLYQLMAAGLADVSAAPTIAADRERLTPPARWTDHGTNRTFGRGMGVATRAWSEGRRPVRARAGIVTKASGAADRG